MKNEQRNWTNKKCTSPLHVPRTLCHVERTASSNGLVFAFNLGPFLSLVLRSKPFLLQHHNFGNFNLSSGIRWIKCICTVNGRPSGLITIQYCAGRTVWQRTKRFVYREAAPPFCAFPRQFSRCNLQKDIDSPLSNEVILIWKANVKVLWGNCMQQIAFGWI